MFQFEDNTFRDLREKSLLHWLEEMEQHEDMSAGAVSAFAGNIFSPSRIRMPGSSRKTS